MASSTAPFKLGTRGSVLAMAQAEAVKLQLEPLLGPVQIVKVKTSGDIGDRTRMGAFVSEIEDCLRLGSIDLGLHCLKDIPTRPLDGLTFAAYLPREDVRDAMITRGRRFFELADGSVVGTGSLRRTSQLAAHGRSFTFKPLIGNVDTRLGKLKSGEYDAIVLAIAGLNRLGLVERWDQSPYSELVIEILETSTMLPAAGQATLVLQMRADDGRAGIVASLNHGATEVQSIAERAFLARFGGGCSVPVAAHAKSADQHYILEGLISSPDGKISYRGSKAFGADQGEYFGRELAEELGYQGGFEVVNEVVERQQK